MAEPEVIFRTVHGSRLYGWARDDSDHDVFIVTTSSRSKASHSVDRETGVDSVRVGLDTFLTRCYEGSHQSVEALFSPYKVWAYGEKATYFRHYLDGMRVTGSAVFAKYERTIKTFAFGDYKRRRHAARLALNLADLRAEGRFSPVLTPAQREYCGRAAERLSGEQLWNYLL